MLNNLFARTTTLLCFVVSALASGCGGALETPTTDAAQQPSAAAVSTPALQDGSRPTESLAAYNVSPDEVLQNGLFAKLPVTWQLSDAKLVASSLRDDGLALDVGWKACQTLPATALLPGHSYRLKVVARNLGNNGAATLSVQFRLASGAEIFRNYETTVSSTAFDEYIVDFRAPAYVGKVDVVFVAHGSRAVIESASLKMRSALPQTEPITSSTGSYVPSGYVLAFNDEFNGTELNRDKWFTRYIYSEGTLDRLHDEKQRYRDNNNHKVAYGVLSLTARQVSNVDPDGINYESGMVRSDWTARYGFYEARVSMPAGRGVWSAFWLNSDASEKGALAWPPEIDIFEFVNNGVEDTPNMLHSALLTPGDKASPLLYADPAFDPNWQYYLAPYKFTEGWHTVGAEWTPTSVAVFVDGKRIYKRSYLWNAPDGTLAGPAHILLNLAIGGDWAGRHGIDNAAFPQSMLVDWVRAYQKKES